MMFLVWGPLSVITIIFHEMGHIWQTRRQVGGTATHTMLWPLGGFNDCSITNGTCLQEFCVAFCGPMMHIPQFVVWTVIMALAAPNGIDWYGQGFSINQFESGPAEYFAELSKRMIDVNIMVFIINLLLPAYPMDAANMVAALAVHFGMSVEGAGMLLVVLGVVLGIIALVFGIINMINGGAAGLFMIFIAVFVFYTSWTLWRQIQAGQIHLHPIFKADCYKGRSSGSSSDVEMGRGNSERTRRSSSMSNPPDSPRRSQAPKPKKMKTTKNAGKKPLKKSNVNAAPKNTAPPPKRKARPSQNNK